MPIGSLDGDLNPIAPRQRTLQAAR